MTTYFDTLSKSFADVQLEPGVNTAEFLEASRGLVKMFDLLGSGPFSLVQSDINGNINKIQTRLTADPVNSATLEGMLAAEAKGSDKTATQGLLWLLRGLEFTLVGLQSSLANPNEELSKSFTTSYGKTLSNFHNFLARGAFKVAMAACPARATFYKKLAKPSDDLPEAASQEKVQEQGEKWLNGLEVIIKRMKALYAEHDYGKGL